MHFKLIHRFAVSPREYVEAVTAPGYDQFVAERLSLRERREISRDDAEPVVSRTVRVIPERDLPSAIAKLTGGRTLAYDETIDLDVRTGRGAWKVTPGLLQGRVKAGGTFVLDPDEGSGGCVRTVEGDISVKIFGAAAMVEKFIVAQVKDSYDRGADVVREWIERLATQDEVQA